MPDLAATPLDPDTMTLDQLRAEAWFWRENCAATLFFALIDLTHKGAGGSRTSRRETRRRVEGLTGQLESVLSGDVFATCPICDEPLVPGQASLRDASEGDVHAACLAEACDPNSPEIRPGDTVQCDPRSIVDDDDEPIAGHDGRLIAMAVSRMDTTAGLVKRAMEAREVLSRKGSPHG